MISCLQTAASLLWMVFGQKALCRNDFSYFLKAANYIPNQGVGYFFGKLKSRGTFLCLGILGLFLDGQGKFCLNGSGVNCGVGGEGDGAACEAETFKGVPEGGGGFEIRNRHNIFYFRF